MRIHEVIVEQLPGRTIPEKIIPLEMPTPPKAPDATIPRRRDGYTTNDGVTYKQDKYDENIMHVSGGFGTFTFDGDRIIKWASPKISGQQEIRDFINRTINIKGNTVVNTGDGDVVIGTDAVYDLKGNLKDAGNTKISAGGLSVSGGTKGVEIRYTVSDSLEVRIKSNPRKAQAMNTEELKGLAGKLQPLFKSGDVWKAVRTASKYADITLLWNGQAKHPAEIETLVKQSQGENNEGK